MAVWKSNCKEGMDFDQRFAEVYQDNSDRVYQYISSIVHNGPAAEDLTVEAIFTIWKKKDSLLQYKNIEGLLFKISRDLSLNHLKREIRNQKKKEEFIRNYFSRQSEEEEEILHENRLLSMEQAINQLPEKCREVVRMKFIAGKSLKEIAAELHISVNTVKNHLSRGKLLIREQLKSNGILVFTGFLLYHFFNP